MQKKWAQIQLILEKKLTPGQYKVWIAPLAPAWEEEALALYAPSDFVADFVRGRFLSLIAEATGQIMGQDCPVRVRCRPAHVRAAQNKEPLILSPHDREGGTPDGFSSDDDSAASSLVSTALAAPARSLLENAPGQDARQSPPSPRPLSMAQLPLPVRAPEVKACPAAEYAWRFSFEDFVIGPCNELAHAAARSMCGGRCGPDILFLSSAPGLGKTHLMQAVGRTLGESCNRKSPRVEYLTAEEFASRFYLSLKLQDTDRFKARYRDLDLLLLEDVHFLQSKEKMQAELLATIKSLQDRGGKVVFTSSFGPKDLRHMDEQLQSRFCAGLLSFIDRPDEQTRRRILRHKASLHQVLLPDDVEDILARHIQADVRQIESCLQNLILKARLLNTGITTQMAWEVIVNYAAHSPVLDIEAIIRQVCQGFGLSKEQLVSASRKQEYVTARNTAFYLARKHTDLSLAAIGQLFNRKHSTVMKGITNLEREMSRESSLGRQIINSISMIERNGNIVAAVQ